MTNETRWVAIEIPALEEGWSYRLLNMSGLEVVDSPDLKDILLVLVGKLSKQQVGTPLRIVKRRDNWKRDDTPEQHMAIDMREVFK